tara:strand:- start:302 stop:760 length:459 start_codon:yes stop_codon:yes gene_type:complete
MKLIKIDINLKYYININYIMNLLILLIFNLSYSYELYRTTINVNNNIDQPKFLDPYAGKIREGMDERYNKTENILYYNNIDSTHEHLNPHVVIAKINKNMESKYLLDLLLNKNIDNFVKLDYISKYNHVFDDNDNKCDLYKGDLINDWEFTF